MTQKKFDYHTIVIGGGAGGLVVASGLAKAGKAVLLIEKSLLGGDCTHVGCIPSKSLIASAEQSYTLHSAYSKGLDYNISDFNGDGALERVRYIVDKVAKSEDQASMIDKGIHVLRARATFIDPHTLSCILPDGNVRNVTAKFVVIATGSKPLIPDQIEGLSECPYLTNESIFNLKKIPRQLAVMGTGPIGIELASAFRRLGSQVTIIGRSKSILKKEEPEAQTLIKESMQKEGVVFLSNAKVTRIDNHGDDKVIYMQGRDPLVVSDILIAIGRELNTHNLNLQNANVYYNEDRIQVDRYGRTTQKNIFAVGDVTGHGYFTHVAEHQGRGVFKSLMLWPLLFSIDQKQLVPRVTFTPLEVASIGLNEQQALNQYGDWRIATYHVPFSHVDRAITQGEEEGFVKIVTKRFTSRILGATVVAQNGGELLLPLSLAIQQKIPLRKFASLIHPYPTLARVIRKAADLYYVDTLLHLFKSRQKK